MQQFESRSDSPIKMSSVLKLEQSFVFQAENCEDIRQGFVARRVEDGTSLASKDVSKEGGDYIAALCSTEIGIVDGKEQRVFEFPEFEDVVRYHKGSNWTHITHEITRNVIKDSCIKEATLVLESAKKNFGEALDSSLEGKPNAAALVSVIHADESYRNIASDWDILAIVDRRLSLADLRNRSSLQESNGDKSITLVKFPSDKNVPVNGYFQAPTVRDRVSH